MDLASRTMILIGASCLSGGAQQRETAFQMDTVCGLIGGCRFVVNTGDNFYDCGVYPGDNTRLVKDWEEVYKRPEFTPNIAHLKWYNTFGNHDMRINGESIGDAPRGAMAGVT